MMDTGDCACGRSRVRDEAALWFARLTDAYETMFYAITGTMFAVIASAMAYSFVAMFRVLAGRVNDVDVLAGHALYWYAVSGTFAAMWFVVYVQK